MTTRLWFWHWRSLATTTDWSTGELATIVDLGRALAALDRSGAVPRLFPGELAYALFFSLLKRSGAMAASSVTFLIPVFAILWGAAILGETIDPQLLLGMLVTLAGTALAVGIFPRKRAGRP